jgi:hypothetical protein
VGFIFQSGASAENTKFTVRVYPRIGKPITLENFRIYDSEGPTHFKLHWEEMVVRIYFPEIKIISFKEDGHCEVIFKSGRKETYQTIHTLLWGESKWGEWKNWLSRIEKIEFEPSTKIDLK